MKVVHIESGLGNQMLSFCEYLVLKKLHPNEDIYIENLIFDIPEANDVIRQWNGYELERIFGIKAPNIRDILTEEQWLQVMKEVRASKFWERNWNYPIYITQALEKVGIQLLNIRGNTEAPKNFKNHLRQLSLPPSIKKKVIHSRFGSYIKGLIYQWKTNHYIKRHNHKSEIFYTGSESIFTGQWLGMKHKEAGLEFIEKEMNQAFKFPPFNTDRNKEMSEYLQSCQSVAIHARRGDMLGANGYCYKFGYFQRAIKLIRRKIENPVFVFFCDPGSISWCKDNADIFGLDFHKDKVYFVDWNHGEDSYRDMQLMAQCKHAIITNSTFGWWGAFFIENPNKITISPKQESSTATTHHC